MELIRSRHEMQRRAHELRRDGVRLGFVPTMGALHAGHLALLQTARPGCDLVAASIFVNPLQFGPGEDFDRYPRDLEGDVAQLARAGCGLVFAPQTEEMYAPQARTHVEVRDIQDVLCGRSRPGHFRGVATVVAKLLNLVQPAVVVFGQKDAQQAILLRRMLVDLDWPVEMRVAPIVREPDGLALSSRNAFLSAEERREAPLLHAALHAAQRLIESGERRAAIVLERARDLVNTGTRLRLDYLAIVDTDGLRPLETIDGEVLIAVAAYCGATRLIDNVVLEVRDDDVHETELRGRDARTDARGREA